MPAENARWSREAAAEVRHPFPGRCLDLYRVAEGYLRCGLREGHTDRRHVAVTARRRLFRWALR